MTQPISLEQYTERDDTFVPIWHSPDIAKQWERMSRMAEAEVIHGCEILKPVPQESVEFHQLHAALFESTIPLDIVPTIQRFWLHVHELWKNNIGGVRQKYAEPTGGEEQQEQAFIRDFIQSQENIVLFQNQITGEFLMLPREEMYTELYFSRIHPVMSKEELTTLKLTAVVVLGASSGEVAAKLLGKLGVEVHLTDPDTVDQSNVLRLDTSTTVDTGKSKVLQTGKNIVESFPFSSVYLYPRILHHQELFELVQGLRNEKQRVVVVDAIDDLATKVMLRYIGYALGVPVCMNNNVAHEATIVTDSYAEPLMQNPETATYETFLDWIEQDEILETVGLFGHSEMTKKRVTAKLAELKSVQGLDFARAFTKLVIEIVGTSYFPPRQMVNVLLGSQGIQNYLSQSGVNAQASGAVQSRVITQLLLGRRVVNRLVLDMDATIGTAEQSAAADDEFLPQIVAENPHFWQKYAEGKSTLLAVLQAAVRDVFGIEYTYQYRTL